MNMKRRTVNLDKIEDEDSYSDDDLTEAALMLLREVRRRTDRDSDKASPGYGDAWMEKMYLRWQRLNTAVMAIHDIPKRK